MTRGTFTVRESADGPRGAIFDPDWAPKPPAGSRAELLRYEIPSWDHRTLDELMAAWKDGSLK